MNSGLLMITFSDSRRSHSEEEEVFGNVRSTEVACMSGCEALSFSSWLTAPTSNAESTVSCKYFWRDNSNGANRYVDASSLRWESVSEELFLKADKKKAARSRTSSSLSYRQRWRSIETRARNATEHEPKLASAQTAEARIVAFSRMTRL